MSEGAHVLLGASQASAFCRGCKQETRWYSDGPIDGGHYWRCAKCGHRRMQLADAYDAGNIPPLVVGEYIRRHGQSSLDCVGGQEDAIGHLFVELWTAWVKYEPERGVPFTAYCTGTLRNRLANLVRNTVGGHGGAAVRPMSLADSLSSPELSDDPDRLERAFGRVEDDSLRDSDLDVARVLQDGDRAVARRDREADRRAAGRAAPRDSAAA